MINILLLSVGTRNKVVEYFVNNMNDQGEKLGNIIATDASKYAPALYEADKHYVVPRIDDPKYLDIILDICKQEKISGVLSLIDPELSLISKNKDRFNDLGVTVIGSEYSINERSLDKQLMYNWLIDNNYKTAKSYFSLDSFLEEYYSGLLSFPVFVKPIKGSASLSISKVNDLDTLKLLMSNSDNLMIQELMDGQELGIDVYIDLLSKEVVSIFCKKKLLMRAGETDKSISFKNQVLFSLVEKFVLESGFIGQIDIDVFDINGEYYISEVNPRFGGGYPHAYLAGSNHIKMIINNLLGKTNDKVIGEYKDQLVMMKYNEVFTMEDK